MKHLDTIHKAMGDHASKSMQMFQDSHKSMEKHAESANALGETMQALAAENSEFLASSMQQMMEATQAIMASMSAGMSAGGMSGGMAGGMPGVGMPGAGMAGGGMAAAMEIQQNYMNESREALTNHMARMSEAMAGLAKDAGAPMAEAIANLRKK